MSTWTSEELKKIGTAEELQIASRRPDGTLSKQVIIWVVRLGDYLYVRSYKGRTSGWFSGVLVRNEGHIQAGGVAKDVSFVEVTDPEINKQISAAYRTKYHRYAESIVGSMVTPEAQAATIKMVPRQAGAVLKT